MKINAVGGILGDIRGSTLGAVAKASNAQSNYIRCVILDFDLTVSFSF